MRLLAESISKTVAEICDNNLKDASQNEDYCRLLPKFPKVRHQMSRLVYDFYTGKTNLCYIMFLQ